MTTKKLFRYAKVSVLSLGLLAASCTQEATDETVEIENGIDLEGPIVKRFFGEEPLEGIDLGDGTYKIYGDVIVDENQFTENPVKSPVDQEPDADADVDDKIALFGGIRKWTNNTVVYRLGNLNESVRSELFKSMKVWEDNTNIRFKEFTGSEANYVTISSNGDACNCGSARLGMSGRSGTMRLGTRTTAVVIIHEIGHTLGFIHEQTRSDRDQFVRILFDNIQPGAVSQFRKNTRSENLGAFDIESTMMYGAYTFSRNRQPTITRLDGTIYPRRQARLSAGDIAGTNRAYPGSTVVDPDPDKDICEGVEAWVRGRRYQVGDKVTYRGFLFERDFSRWNRLGECGETEVTDICEGIDAYVNGRNYSPGDQVTFRGFLFTKLNRGWRQEGPCGQ